MKRKSLIILTVLSVIAILSPITIALAAEQREKSNLIMSAGTTLTGAGRNYNYKNHKISLYPTYLEYAYYNTYNRVDITIAKKGLLGYSDKKTVTAKIYSINKTYTYEMGAQGKGTFRYRFYTGTNYQPWSGYIKADPVYMYSYE